MLEVGSLRTGDDSPVLLSYPEVACVGGHGLCAVVVGTPPWVVWGNGADPPEGRTIPGTKQPDVRLGPLDEQRSSAGAGFALGGRQWVIGWKWRLVGRGDRLLDSGEIDNGFPDPQ